MAILVNITDHPAEEYLQEHVHMLLEVASFLLYMERPIFILDLIQLTLLMLVEYQLD